MHIHLSLDVDRRSPFANIIKRLKARRLEHISAAGLVAGTLEAASGNVIAVSMGQTYQHFLFRFTVSDLSSTSVAAGVLHVVLVSSFEGARCDEHCPSGVTNVWV